VLQLIAIDLAFVVLAGWPERQPKATVSASSLTQGNPMSHGVSIDAFSVAMMMDFLASLSFFDLRIFSALAAPSV